MNTVVIGTSSEVGRHPVQVLQAGSASFALAPHTCAALMGMLPIAVPALSGDEYRDLQAQFSVKCLILVDRSKRRFESFQAQERVAPDEDA